MQQPKNVHDALRHLHNLTMCIAKDVENYLEDPTIYGNEYFEDVKNAALDAHLLVTWIRDRIE
jgi:hypothetical protein